MATTIQRLARWARTLTLDDVPARVQERARLQQLAVAGSVRAVRDRPLAAALRKAGSPRGAAPVVTGGTAPRRDAARLHGALSCWLDQDDYLFMGHTGHGAVCPTWAYAGKDTSLADILTATVAANEVAGRVGASLLLGPNNGQAWAAVHAAAATVSAGLLSGLDEDALGHALALALAVPHRVPMSTILAGGDAKALVAAVPIVAGLDAVDLAAAGVTGPLDLLDTRDGLFSALAWVPLRGAFTGLGQAWLTSTLAFKLMPGCAYIHTPVQAVHEILRRHVKASERRIRPDQIDRIEVTTGLLGWGLERLASQSGRLDPAAVPFSVRRSIAVLVLAHELSPTQLEQGWLADNADAIGDLAQRCTVHHDWRHTMETVEHLVGVAAPLLGGVTLDELRSVGKQAAAAYGGEVPRPGAAELLAIVKHRPDQLFERIRYAPADLADARLDEWQFRFPADVRLFTTRGGSWPEKRVLPEGSPGWPWDDTVARVLARWGEDGRARLEAPASSAGTDWVAALLG